jgi:hypothetical protein
MSNEKVCLQAPSGKFANLMLLKLPHLENDVYNPCTKWATYKCVCSYSGNICKYHVKILKKTRPNLAERKCVVHYLGVLCNTSYGKFLKFFYSQESKYED